MIIFCILFRDSKSELIIHLDTEAEEKYLTVEELGSTLNILSDSLKGKIKLCSPVMR